MPQTYDPEQFSRLAGAAHEVRFQRVFKKERKKVGELNFNFELKVKYRLHSALQDRKELLLFPWERWWWRGSPGHPWASLVVGHVGNVRREGDHRQGLSVPVSHEYNTRENEKNVISAGSAGRASSVIITLARQQILILNTIDMMTTWLTTDYTTLHWG